MSARTASCPECLGGKVNLITLKCASCGHSWLTQTEFDASVRTAFAGKAAYLQSEVYKDLEQLIAQSKQEVITDIAAEISKSQDYLEKELDKLTWSDSRRTELAVQLKILNSLQIYLNGLFKKVTS